MPKNNKKSAQEIQDEIFHRFPEKKIRLKAQMLALARELSGHKGEDLMLRELTSWKEDSLNQRIKNIKSIIRLWDEGLDKRYLFEQSRKQGTWDELNKML